MPQMGPLNWLSLMLMFSCILIMFNILNNYSFNYQIKENKINYLKTPINWKW